MIPDKFESVNVTDTCAVWHLIAADTLFQTARRVKLFFIITQTVFFECFVKSRGRPITAKRAALRQRLRDQIDNNCISQMEVSIDDLQEAIAVARQNGWDKRLGHGELSCAALVRNLGHAAVLTDNKRDFTVIRGMIDERLQTTPRLLGWLYVEGELSDAGVKDVVCEHEEFGGHMVDVYNKAYREACEKRLMRQMVTASANEEG